MGLANWKSHPHTHKITVILRFYAKTTLILQRGYIAVSKFCMLYVLPNLSDNEIKKNRCLIKVSVPKLKVGLDI